MKKILRWLKYLLPLAILLMFKKSKASTESFTHFLTPATEKQKDDFLLEAKRSDWNEDDVYSAKLFIQELLGARTFFDINSLPAHYLALIDDTFLLDSKTEVDLLAKKLADERTRRGI